MVYFSKNQCQFRADQKPIPVTPKKSHTWGSPPADDDPSQQMGNFYKDSIMPRGDKLAYTDKQKRMAQHIEESYLEKGRSQDDAEAIAWATVNKEAGGGRKSGSGRRHSSSYESTAANHKSGSTASSDTNSTRSQTAMNAAAQRTPAQRSASAKKAAETRKRNAAAKSKTDASAR